MSRKSKEVDPLQIMPVKIDGVDWITYYYDAKHHRLMWKHKSGQYIEKRGAYNYKFYKSNGEYVTKYHRDLFLNHLKKKWEELSKFQFVDE
jgi:hypothetical protein